MKSTDKICADFGKRVTRFFETTQDWRKEAAICWEFYDGHPTGGGEFEHIGNGHAGRLNGYDVPKRGGRKSENAPVVTAFVNAIVGLMMRDQKRIRASSASDVGESEESSLNKGFRYFDAVTHRPAVKTKQATASAVQGVGATVTSLDFTIDNAIAGQPVYEEQDMIFFDRGNGGDLDSAKIGWCGYAEPLYRESMDDYIERCMAEKDFPRDDQGNPYYFNGDFRSYLFEHRNYEDEQDVEFLYHYYWREYRKVWDIENPFKVMPDFLVMLTDEFPEAANVFAETAQALQLDFDQSHFTLDTEHYKKFRDLIENIEFMTGQEVPEIEASSRMGRAYYKAEFGNGMMLKKTPSFTTQCHAMNFVTSCFDKTYGYHYGIMRPLAFFAKMLNESVSDMTTYSSRSASGGNVGVKGAADTIKLVKKALEDGHQVVPAKDGMEMQNLGTPDAAQAIMATNDLILKLIPMSMGMPPELFGMLSTGDMTDSLMNKIRQQMNATLTHLYANMDKSTLCDGWIQRDLFLEMAQGVVGILELEFVLGGEDGVFELSRKDLARNYNISLVEREATADEELEGFERLEKLIDKIIDKVSPEHAVEIAAELVKIAPIMLERKKALVDILTPRPPDPALVEQQNKAAAANIRLVEAQAYQLEQQGEADAGRAAVAGREAALKLQSEAADIEETKSKTKKNLVDAAVKANDGKIKQVETINNLTNPNIKI